MTTKALTTTAPVQTPTHPGWLGSLRAALVLIALCGGVYPLVTVSLDAALFPTQSAGSLIRRGNEFIGSRLVGQPFAAPGYFHGRPSAAHYDPFAVTGSNLAPSNPALRRRAAATSRAVAAADGVAPDAIPVDLIAASGSGIDPDISPAAAYVQVKRVAAARDLPPATIGALVRRYTRPPTFGVLGRPRVNVLMLNLALDALPTHPSVKTNLKGSASPPSP